MRGPREQQVLDLNLTLKSRPYHTANARLGEAPVDAAVPLELVDQEAVRAGEGSAFDERELAVVGFSPCELWGLDEVSVMFTAWVEAGEVSSTSSVACVAVSLSLAAVRGLSGANGVSSTGSVPTMKSSRTEAVCDPPGSSGPEEGGSFVSFCIWTYA